MMEDDWDPLQPSKFSEDINDIYGDAIAMLKPNLNHPKPLLSLHNGDPSVSGEFPIHENMKLAVQKALKIPKNSGYTASFGTKEAREALAKHYSVTDCPLDADDVVLTHGTQGALNILLKAFCNPDDNFLVPAPAYPYAASVSKALKLNHRIYKLNPDADWEADIKNMESLIDDNTRFILINNPSSATGSVYTRKYLEDILAVADKYKIPLVTDESYSATCFGTEFISLGALAKDIPIILVASLANYMAPGWRLGWMVFYDKNKYLSEIKAGAQTLTQIMLHPPSFLQAALPEILTAVPKEYYKDLVAPKLKINQELIETLFLKELETFFKYTPAKSGISTLVLLKKGAFKDIKDENEFCQKLLEEENVLLAPTNALLYEGGFRISLTEKRKSYEEFSERLREFCKRHSA